MTITTLHLAVFTPIVPLYVSYKQKNIKPNPASKDSIYNIIDQINSRNSKIQTIYIEKFPILFKDRVSVNLNATMRYSKKLNYRLEVVSNFSKEMDIGSNDDEFWFWSKRMIPSQLMYAQHSDLNKTRLKNALNPMWMIESLALDRINIKNVEIRKLKDNFLILETRKNSINQDITIVTMISGKQIIGKYLYATNGKMDASCEIESFQEVQGCKIPYKLRIIWYSENVQMYWKLDNVKINSDISDSYFIKPKMRNSINIGKD